MTRAVSVLSEDGLAEFYPDIFAKSESDRLLERLINEIQWKHEPIVLFGKKVMQPRLTALYGDDSIPYRYSGITLNPLPWSSALLEIKARVELLAKTSFTTVLLNHYRGGADSMGWHQDDERELGVNPTIASVSFGATRRFKMKHRTRDDRTIDLDLTHGSALIMSGAMQHHWKHSIPKSKRVTAPRINLTFRRILL